MINKLIYIILKIYSLLFGSLLKKNIHDPGVIIKKYKKKEIKSIGLYLDNKYLVHIGDHLFFEPILNYFKNQNIQTIY